ncbi:VOC family protein [Mycolicibacterium sp. HK-90]|jgi:catechol 2,3-dioxygenase-like lactoylglutathione lyase family enzyme|uniref:VOC family protein n=1 Tax=Mycobacteriaceae TaxID=1762 RepID=UPI00265B40E1|nr:VOC family protein [Mycolicibacterium sp. HK-90]WKG04014.1 VOC family protein [Mycolicibacterium sp. HK-90]
MLGSPLAATDCYHVGIVAADIDVAAQRLTASAGYEWTRPIDYTVEVVTSSGERHLPFRFVYSLQAPHIELIAEVPGTPWTAPAHHLGYFVDDIAAVSTRLESAGFKLEVKPVGDIADSFAYFIDPAGIRIELVNRALFPDWPAFLNAAADRR